MKTKWAKLTQLCSEQWIEIARKYSNFILLFTIAAGIVSPIFTYTPFFIWLLTQIIIISAAIVAYGFKMLILSYFKDVLEIRKALNKK